MIEPCPFCGSRDIGNVIFSLACMACGARGPTYMQPPPDLGLTDDDLYGTHSSKRLLWNRRVLALRHL
jgi:hypothetical protein